VERIGDLGQDFSPPQRESEIEYIEGFLPGIPNPILTSESGRMKQVKTKKKMFVLGLGLKALGF